MIKGTNMSERMINDEQAFYGALGEIYERENIFVFDTIDSTNTYAKSFAREYNGEAVFIAHGQTAGRGRMGRSFHSAEGKGLFMSILTRCGLVGVDATRLTTLTAVAVARAIRSVCPIDAKIKWVNDIYVDLKKLAGILVEGQMSVEGELEYAVIGIGVNLLRQDYPCEISTIATSIEECCGVRVEPIDLAIRIVKEINTLLENPLDKKIMKEYKERSMLIGKCVTVLNNGGYTAMVTDITDDARLVVESERGREELYTGDVSIKL